MDWSGLAMGCGMHGLLRNAGCVGLNDLEHLFLATGTGLPFDRCLVGWTRMDMVGDWCLDVRWDDRWMDRDQNVGAAAGTGGLSRGPCGRVIGGDGGVGMTVFGLWPMAG